MRLPVTLSLASGLLNPSVAPHVTVDSKLAVFVQPPHLYGSVKLGDSAHHSDMEGYQ